MTRLIISVLTGLSLLLCLTAVRLWLRSYRVGDSIARCDSMKDQRFLSALGRVSFVQHRFLRADFPNMDDCVGEGWHYRSTSGRILRSSVESRNESWRLYRGVNDLAFSGLRYRSGDMVVGSQRYGPVTVARACELSVPYWLITVTMLLLPARFMFLQVRRMQRQRRRATGVCTRCGYDLRATPGWCPECGTEAPARKARDESPASSS